ncbi:MAG: T9SS type A sorting domain-containing protein, partial [Ignavibacteriae bacterium]|nr:T9SS type A sorting domain-containing protein [Ignavibacteriota bacterium]
LDPLFGAFPPNVYVFDFFHKLVGSNYMLLLTYATDPDNSHPNAAATTLVAPQFVNEIFNKSILYESTYGIREINSIVSDFKLYQNYPNPFNPYSVIRFQIKDLKFVTLKVFDVLGKEVATLVNEKLNAGEYEVTFDGSDIPSGIYFYKLVSGDFSVVKKMVLIK